MTSLYRPATQSPSRSCQPISMSVARRFGADTANAGASIELTLSTGAASSIGRRAIGSDRSSASAAGAPSAGNLPRRRLRRFHLLGPLCGVLGGEPGVTASGRGAAVRRPRDCGQRFNHGGDDRVCRRGGGPVTGELLHYSRQQLAAIALEDRIVWLGFPSSFEYLVECWFKGTSPSHRPRLDHLVAYSVMKLDAPRMDASGTATRRAWTSPLVGFAVLRNAADRSVDPASIIAGQPSCLARGAER
jgi:hypothetical protein